MGTRATPAVLGLVIVLSFTSVSLAGDLDSARAALAEFEAVAAQKDLELKDLPANERSSDAGIQLAWEVRRAHFQVCTGNYQVGLCLQKGSAGHEARFQKTISMLMDFVWDNEDNILGGWCYLYLGLSHQELDHPGEALEFLKVAAAAYPVPDRADAANYPKWTDLYLRGYVKLAEYCNELKMRDGKDYREVALKVLLAMSKRVPDLWQRQFGHLAIIQQAQAMKDLGRVEEARALLERIIVESRNLPADTKWGDSTSFLAEQILAQITAEAVLPATAEALMRAAMVRKREHKWADAEAGFLAAAAACATEDEIRDFAIPAWMEVGECRYRDERFKEAYDAYDHLLKNFKSLDPDRAGDAAYFRYRAATALHAKTREASDEALKKQARASFAASYPDHPRAINLRYYEGADLVAEGDLLLSQGKREPALEAYARAADLFVTVKPTSVLYAKARARVVEINYKTGAHDEVSLGLAKLLAYLADPKNRTTDRQRTANRQSAGALATYYGARSLEKLGRWQEMLDLLAKFETKYASEQAKGFHAPVKAARARAQKELGAPGEEDAPSDD